MAVQKVATQIRLDEKLYSLVKSIAEVEMRSINAQMEYFIREGAEKYKDENFMFGCDDCPEPED